ncbi:MAG: hypothetical protein KAR01_13420 [Desulfocapsa sp.]|nr:hypothetical protein [Desulfocapsa sp.]
MSLRSEWPCWEIMKCDEAQKCPAKENSSKLCWEIIEEVDKYSFNICSDCLVYVTKQKDSQFTKEEILSIMAQKGVDVLTDKNCPLKKRCETN